MSQFVYTPTRAFTPSAAITQFARVKLASDGTISTAGATDTDIGIAMQSTYTTGQNPLAQISVLLNTAQGSRKMIAGTTFSKGDVIYNAALGKVGSSNNGYIAGIALEAASSGGDIVEVLHVSDFSATALTDHQIAAIVAASTAVTADNTENTFSNGTYNMSANTFAAGDVVRVRGQGIATATNSTDTLTIKVKNGSNVLLNSGAVDVADNDIFYFDLDFVCRSIGTSGTFTSCGAIALGTPGTVTLKPGFKASTTLNTQTTVDVKVTATWSVNSASNSCRLDIYDVQHLLA